MDRRRSTARIAVAVAVSIAAHLALLFLARSVEPAPASAARERPIELEVLHLPPAASGAGRVHEEPPPPQHGVAPNARPVPTITGQAPEGVQVAEPPHGGAAGLTGPAPEGVQVAVPPRGPDPTARRLDLLPDRYDLAGIGPPADGAASAAGPAPESGVQQRLEGLLADDRAMKRGVERVDAYWAGLRHDLEQRWEVDADLLRDGPTRGLGVKLDEAIEGWQKQARAYAATGNPYGDGPTVPGSPQVADYARPLELPELPTGLYEGAADESAFRKHRAALVLLTQDESGRVVDVRLQRASGNAAFDRQALAGARALAQRDLGLPPEGNQSVWSFEATLITTPPLPIAGCNVDAYFIPQNCFYPLSERVRQAVRLVGVWKAGETPGVR